MYSNDTAILGASTVVAPSILGMIIWPNLVVGILIAVFVILTGLFVFFKIRNKTK